MKLLVIDTQRGITDERLYNYEEFIDNTKRIIEAARANAVEVIYVQHDDGPGSGFSYGDDEFEIAEEFYPKEQEKRYYKTVNSCFANKELEEYLKSEQEDSLMIVGLQTNYCIDASIKSAFDKGYKVIVPKGTNSTFDNDYMDRETTYKYYNDMMWPGRFADCVTMDEALALLKR